MLQSLAPPPQPPHSLLPAIVAARVSNEEAVREGGREGGSEPSGKKELYFFMRANLLFSRSEVERSELKNSTVYKLSVIGLGNTATVCVQ